MGAEQILALSFLIYLEFGEVIIAGLTLASAAP